MRRRAFLTPLRWLALSVRRGFSSGLPVVALSAVATLVLAAVLVPIITVSRSVDAQRSGSGVLTQIAVSPIDDGSGEVRALTTAARDRLAALPGVRAVTPDVSTGVYAGGEGTWSTTIHTVNPANLPPGVDPRLATALREGEVIVPAAIGQTVLADSVGNELVIEFTRASGENEGELERATLRPVASYDPAWQGYGPNAILGSEGQVALLLAARAGVDVDTYLDKIGIAGVTVSVDSESGVTETAQRIRDLGFDARPHRDSLGELPGVLGLFPAIFGTVAVAVVLLLGLLVLTVVRGAVTRRASEFGLLRIRGWTVADVRTLIVLDLGAGSLVGSVLGVATGTALGLVIASGAANGVAASPGGDVVSPELLFALGALVAGPVLLSVAVGLAASARALRRDPYLALVRPG